MSGEGEEKLRRRRRRKVKCLEEEYVGGGEEEKEKTKDRSVPDRSDKYISLYLYDTGLTPFFFA